MNKTAVLKPLPATIIAILSGIPVYANDFYKAHDMEDDYQLWLNSSEFLYDTPETPGDDIIISSAGVILGEDGNDVLRGSDNTSLFNGGKGNDMMFGGGSRDTMGTCSEAGHDRFYGEGGDDQFCDDTGHNEFHGGGGNDTLILPNGFDNKTDNTYVYTSGHDTLDLGEGIDTLVLKNVKASEATQWNVHLIEPFAFSLPLISNSAYLYSSTSEKSGYIEGPNGERVDFKGVNKLEVQYTYPVQFNDFWNDPYIVGTIISGLPEGFSIKGMTMEPQLHEDGYWFQAVDPDALAAGQLELIPSQGFVGTVELKVIQVRDRALAITEHQRGTINVDVHPVHDSMLFAKFGAVAIGPNGDPRSFGNINRLPLNIVFNGKAKGTVAISMTDDYDLENDSGELTPYWNRDGLDYYLLHNKSDLKGLTITDRTEVEEIEVSVSFTGSIEGYERGNSTGSTFIGATQYLYKPDFGKGISKDALHERILKIEANIEDYDISRIGNSIVIKHITRKREQFAVDMIDIPLIQFNNGFVDRRQFSGTQSLFGLEHSMPNPERSLIILSNVPTGAVVNNAFSMGYGQFAIFAEDVQNGLVNIDYPSIGDSIQANIDVSVATLSQSYLQVLGTQTRVIGFANASLFAEAGADASLSVGADGVSAEARAYVAAGAVATAGGSIGGLNGEITAEEQASADVAVSVLTSSTQASIGGYAVAEAGATAGATISFENPYIPGTEAGLEGTVGLSATAYVGGDGNFYFGDGRFGGSVEGGVEVGLTATADGYAYNSLAGVGAGVGGGVSAGPGIGVDGGGYAMFEDGELSFGLSGEFVALVGLEFDFDVTVNGNAVADTGVLIGRGVITGAEAVSMGVIDAADAVRSGFITAESAINGGFLRAEDAVLEGFIDARGAINNFGADANELLTYGYSRTDRVAREAISDTVRLVQDNTYNRLSNKTIKQSSKVFRKVF